MSTPALDMDAAIIDGSPVGLTAGILLAQLGVDARVYQRRSALARTGRCRSAGNSAHLERSVPEAAFTLGRRKA